MDSDLFMVSLRDLLDKTGVPRNITNAPAAVDYDPDWSPDGQTIILTSHVTTDNHTHAVSADIYAMRADGTGTSPALRTAWRRVA